MTLKNAVDMMQQALQMLPPGSQQHKDCLKAITSISRHLPQGEPTAGAQQTQLGDILRSTIRNAMLQKVAQTRGIGGSLGVGGGDGGGGGGDQSAPPPSTPLPGM